MDGERGGFFLFLFFFFDRSIYFGSLNFTFIYFPEGGFFFFLLLWEYSSKIELVSVLCS